MHDWLKNLHDDQKGADIMESLDAAIKSLVKACTQSDKAQCLKKVSRKFYFVCRQAGMKREDILALATEIIDCFTEDIKSLRGKV